MYGCVESEGGCDCGDAFNDVVGDGCVVVSGECDDGRNVDVDGDSAGDAVRWWWWCCWWRWCWR